MSITLKDRNKTANETYTEKVRSFTVTSLLRVSGIASVRRTPSSGIISSNWVLDFDDLGSEDISQLA